MPNLKIKVKECKVRESGEPASFGKAYREFINRCWRDTPNGVKPNYSEQAINFMLDCAHIANGTSVKGLPQQGYTLTVANIGNLVGDCLHLCYEKNDGDTSIDIWLNPHTQFVNVDMMGITDPENMYHVDFNARKNTADDFADFIENLPNYTGKSKTGESKMKKCSMQKKIESLRKKNEEANLRFFEPIFYVADLRGNEIDSDYEYDDLEDAIDKARELSEENPDTPYTVSSMCNIPCLFNGELFEETEFYSKHHDFGYDEKLNTRVHKRRVREQKGLKATVVGGELAGTYDVEDLWKYARGKTPPSSDGPMSRAILGNQPKLPGYLGPMWDGDGLRYETQEVYNQLSR